MAVSKMDFDVVIPAYNAAESVALSIMSARRAGAARCIVVDDGSTDSTCSVADAAGAEVLRQSNQGASIARQAGLELVTADAVVFLDSDDQVTPAIAKAARLLGGDNSTAVVGGRALLFARSTGRTRLAPVPAPALTTTALLRTPVSPWPPAAAVWRTSSLRVAQSMEIPQLHTRYGEDYELLIRASLIGAVRSVPDITCQYEATMGKSIASASLSLRDAMQIQSHYAKAEGIAIGVWSDREVARRLAWKGFRSVALSQGTSRAVLKLAASPEDALLVAWHASLRLFDAALRIGT